jgi:hypothetical protein
MIVDAFLGNDEVELAQLRIDFLKHVVDKFFVGESSQTFSGHLKELNFSKFILDHSDVAGILEVIVIPPLVKNIAPLNRWTIEEYQRDYFLLEVQKRTHQDDVILFCDLDEIPSISQVQWCARLSDEPVNLKMLCFYRRANWLVKGPNEEWRKAKAFKSKAAKSGIRYSIFRDSGGNDGTHMSYLGMSPIQIQKKYSDFSHSELDKPDTSSKAFLDFCDEFGINHTGWASYEGFGLLNISIIPSEDNFQSYLFTNRDEFFDSRTKFKGTILTRMIAARYVTFFLKNFNDSYREAFKKHRVSIFSGIYWHAFGFVIHSFCSVKLRNIAMKVWKFMTSQS